MQMKLEAKHKIQWAALAAAQAQDDLLATSIPPGTVGNYRRPAVNQCDWCGICYSSQINAPRLEFDAVHVLWLCRYCVKGREEDPKKRLPVPAPQVLSFWKMQCLQCAQEDGLVSLASTSVYVSQLFIRRCLEATVPS
jgi:hypothetical protein